MLWRRTILGAMALVLAILFAHLGPLRTRAEDQAEAPAQSVSPVEPGEKAAAGAPGEPASADDETIEIPLSEIWAWNMPATRDVRELESEAERVRYDSLANEIRRVLSRGVTKGELAGPGFVVVGQGEHALKNAFRVLVKKEPSRDNFRAGQELSLVFFSYSSGQYVHLKNVARHKQQIEISYELVPHRTKEFSEHFALISLGRLSPGKYDVEIVRMPLGQQFVQAGFKAASEKYVDRIVCKSLSFTVSD